MKFDQNMRGGGSNSLIRFYVLAIAVGLIFSTVVVLASTNIGTNISTDGTLTVTSLSTYNGFISNASSTITTGLFSMNGGASTTAFTNSGSTWLTNLSASRLLATDNNKMLVSTSTVGVNNLALPKGNFIVGDNVGVAQATSTISISQTGDITLLGRLIIPMGEINYFNTTGVLVSITTQSNGSTNLVKVAPTTSLSSDIFEFDNGGANNGRLRYTGATTKIFHIAFTISMDGEGAGTNLYVFGIAKNGAVGDCKVIQSISVSNDTQSTSLHCMVSLSTNNYIELYAGNLTDADDITVKTINLFAMGL